MKEEGIETLKSLIILTVFLGSAFTVVAMVPPDEVCCGDFKPLEVQKNKVSGPVVVIIETPAAWELEITVTNNLAPVDEENVEVEDEDEEGEGHQPVALYYTRGEGDDVEPTLRIGDNTIINVVVTDKLPAEFELTEFAPTQGDVAIDMGEDGATLITWNVGNLEPEAQATLELTVVTIQGGIAKPGSYVLNSGATATGVWFSRQETLTDGPTQSILVSIIDGTPNEAPVADAGIDQQAWEGECAYLDGSGSYDPDGSVVGYTWYSDEKQIGSSMTGMPYLSVGVHTITLVVEDNRGLTSADEVIVTVYKEDTEVPGGVMTGIVRDATTQRGFDPYIQVTNENFAISTWTDMGGNYKIIGIPAGHYEVYCESEGYRDFYGVVDIRENEEVDYTIDMFRE